MHEPALRVAKGLGQHRRITEHILAFRSAQRALARHFRKEAVAALAIAFRIRDAGCLKLRLRAADVLQRREPG
jgi:hypothetical protein